MVKFTKSYGFAKRSFGNDIIVNLIQGLTI